MEVAGRARTVALLATLPAALAIDFGLLVLLEREAGLPRLPSMVIAFVGTIVAWAGLAGLAGRREGGGGPPA